MRMRTVIQWMGIRVMYIPCARMLDTSSSNSTVDRPMVFLCRCIIERERAEAAVGNFCFCMCVSAFVHNVCASGGEAVSASFAIQQRAWRGTGDVWLGGGRWRRHLN